MMNSLELGHMTSFFDELKLHNDPLAATKFRPLETIEVNTTKYLLEVKNVICRPLPFIVVPATVPS